MKTNIEKCAPPACLSIVFGAVLHFLSLLGSPAKAQVAAPPPLPYSEERVVVGFNYCTRYSNVQGVSVVLVRVSATTPNAPTGVARPPRSENGIPKVERATLAVVETISGGAVPSQLSLTNPPEPPAYGDRGKLEQLLTRRMRVGEYWLLSYFARSGTFDLDAFPGATRLSGLNDPLLHYVRRHFKWLSEPNPSAVFAKVRGLVFDTKEPELSRRLAAGAHYYLRDERGIPAHDKRSLLYPLRQAVNMDYLKRDDAPQNLKLWALNGLDIDATKLLTRGSEDEYKLRYLLRAFSSVDEKTARSAGDRMYYLSIRTGTENGKPVAYYYPDIIEALEAREREDQRNGRLSIATRVLKNLELAHSRRPQDMQKHLTVVTRRLP